jgi:hypothetical protein
MTSQRSLLRSVSASRAFVPFPAVLIILIAFAALAQQATGQDTANASPERAPVPHQRTMRFGARVIPENPLSFLPVVSYDSGGSGEAGDFRTVAVADVNGDGKPDVTVTNFSSNTLGVLLGNGDGTFQSAMTVNPGIQNPTAIVIADVNGDGKPDLVVGIWSGGVGVMLGNGDGTFQPMVTYASGGGQSSDVAVADLNHDGKPDLIVANYGSVVGVLLGNGDGTFQPAVTYHGGSYPFAVAVADVNGDGNPDLLVADGQFGGVAVLLGNANGSFNPAVTYGWGASFAQSIAVADVNGDNRPDLVVATCATSGCDHGAAAVLLGNGDGTFQAAVVYDSGGAGANGLAVADVDGDGKPDLLVANWVSDAVGVLLGNGDGTFQPAVTYGSGGLYPMSIIAADLNDDGKPDLVVGNECADFSCLSGSVGVLLNNTATQSTTSTTLTSSLNPSTHGQPITFTATVTTSGPIVPTGTVNFKRGRDGMGTGTLNASGVATFTTSILKPGPYKITAVYKGDASNLASTSTVLHQGVKRSRP